MPVTSALRAGDYSGNEMLEYLRQNVRNLITVDGIKTCQDIGSPKVLNMVMLGNAVKSGVLPFSTEDIVRIMEKTVKPQFVEINKKALNRE
jgi:indolepyruvate ferredoxin oxidoreductase beta subunit